MTNPVLSPIQQAPSSSLRFFWWCAGASEDILRECPFSERVKYASIGGIVLGTAVLAWISSSFALWTVFGKDGTLGQVTSLVLGVLWATFIFNLDRFIVSSTGKGDGESSISVSEAFNAIPRIAMAAFIGVAVATPLELRIYQPEINARIDSYKHQQQDEADRQLAAEFPDIARFEAEYTQLGVRVAESQARLRAAGDQVAGEIAGRIGSGKPGDGPSTKEARRVKEEREAELRSDSAEFLRRGAVLRDTIAKIVAKRDTAKAVRLKNIDAVDGLAMRLKAGHDVAGGWPEWILRALFIFVEVAPVFFKLMVAKGPYDYLSENQASVLRASHGILLVDDVIHSSAGSEQGQQFEDPQHVKQQRFLEAEFENSQRADALRQALAVSARDLEAWREEQERALDARRGPPPQPR